MPYIDHLRALNRWQPEHFRAFTIDAVRMGRVRHDFASVLAGFPDCFEVTDAAVSLHPQLSDFESRSQAVASVLAQLVERGLVRHLMGEMFPVLQQLGDPPTFQIDRAVVSQFGIRAFGQHLNGYVETAAGPMMWIARRAADRRAFPDRLDQLVAGGLPHGISLVDNLIKECFEEAGMPAELAVQAVATGSVNYCCEVDKGLRDDTLLCYDLKLPASFEPRCTDGEVAGFELLSVEKVAEIVNETHAFKPNCNLVVIDFLLRHGYIDTAHADYRQLQEGCAGIE